MSVVADTTTAISYITQPDALMQELGRESRIVFDLDGTLYDTRDFERPALEAVVAWLRKKSGRPLECMTKSLWFRRERDRHRPGLFDDWLREQRLPVTWGAECQRRFHAHPGTELETAGSLKARLATLHTGDRRLGLVSNGNPELQQRKLTRLGMADIFDIRIFCDPKLPERLKPSPWAWTQLAKWRGAQPAVYVGDDPVDAEFAAAGAVRFVPFKFRSPSYGD